MALYVFETMGIQMQLTKIRRPRTTHPKSPLSKTGSIVCGACGYNRKPSETNPIWQCPCCNAAYVKVNKNPETKLKNSAKQKRSKSEQGKTIRSERSKKLKIAKNMAAFGSYGMLHGLARSCAGLVVSNPAFFLVGVTLLTGAALYYVSTLSNGG